MLCCASEELDLTLIDFPLLFSINNGSEHFFLSLFWMHFVTISVGGAGGGMNK